MLRLLRPRRRDERGAVLAMVGILSSALVVFAAFAVDLGMQRVGRRDMQALADVMALDLARQLDGRTAGALSSDPAFATARDQSLERNGTTFGAEPAVVVQLGSVSAATGEFTEATAGEVPTAVRVVADSEVNFLFVGGSGGVSRDAVAAVALSNPPGITQLNAFGCATIGSYALNLATTNSPVLNALLGDALDTTVLGYDGLATSSVNLDLLTAELGVGSPTELATTNVTVGQLIDAIAAVMTQEGDTQADIDLVESISAALSASTRGTLISMGDIIAIGSGVESALDTEVNVLDLVSGAAFVSNGTHFLDVPGLTVNIPGLSQVDVSLQIGEAPRITCGNLNGVVQRAETSQVRLRVTGRLGGSFAGGGLLSGLLGGTLISNNSTITLEVNAASASAAVTDIQCDGSVPENLVVDVDAVSLASTSLALDLKVQLLGLLSLTDVTANVGTTTPAPSGTYVLPLPQSYTDATRIGSSPTPIPSLSSSNLTVTGVGALTLNTGTLLSSVLNPLVGSLNTLVTTSLVPTLGLTLAGADLKAVPSVACSTPVLVSP